MSIGPDDKTNQAPEERHVGIVSRLFMPLLMELGLFAAAISINMSRLTALTGLTRRLFNKAR